LSSRKPRANASRRRRSLGVQASGATRNPSRASRPLSGRAARYKSGFLITQKRELTSLPVLRYSSGHRKGRLKILYAGGYMKLATIVSGMLVLALFTFSSSPLLGEDIKTRLKGYEETPLTINTNG